VDRARKPLIFKRLTGEIRMSQLIKAVTVWQPWATLIAIDAKPYEFRSWKPPQSLIGQRIAIHAGARPMRAAEVRSLRMALLSPDRFAPPCLRPDIAMPLLERILATHSKAIPTFLPLSHIVCTVTLGAPKRGDACAAEFGAGAGNDSDRDGTFNWGWPMLEVEPQEPPVPARGAQGFWNWGG
jgi:hypothetical protein